MRFDPEESGPSAAELVNQSPEDELARLFFDFGEERFSRRIARRITLDRQSESIRTTGQLADLVRRSVPGRARHGSIDPATRVFQALRIAVNDELGQLDRALPLAWGLLREGGVLAGIAFHSLEDRRVKRFLAARARGCICPPDLPECACGREPEAALIARRAITPSAEELAENPRAASARLRAARKLAGGGRAS